MQKRLFEAIDKVIQTVDFTGAAFLEPVTGQWRG